jgi:molecular chaperone GrpE
MTEEPIITPEIPTISTTQAPNSTNEASPPAPSLDVAPDSAPAVETAEDMPAIEPITLINELKKQLAETEKKAATHWDGLLRQRAEFDNLQKRVERDVENAHKYAIKRFAEELLAVKDSLEMGIEVAVKPETSLDAVKEGMGLTLKILANTLEKFGIVEIDPKNQKFNPEWHEAMAMIPAPDTEDGTIVIVHQKGYQLNDRLLRPARVVIAKNS